jgi:translocation and assembly module TamB
MTRAGRIGRWLAIGAGTITVLLFVAAAVAYQWAQSETGRAWIALQAGRALSTPGETEVSIGHLDGRLPHQIRVGELSVSDGQGVWLEAQNLSLDWHPWSLLDDRFEASLVSADSVHLARLPGGPDTAAQPDAPMELPSLLVRILVRQLTVEQLRLGAPVLGEAIALRIDGGAESREDQALQASLTAERTDGREGSVSLTVLYRPGDGDLEIEAALAEPPGGLAARAMGIPDLPAVGLAVAGRGPVDDWKGRLSLSLEDMAAADVDLAISWSDRPAFAISGKLETLRPVLDPPLPLLSKPIDFSIQGAWEDGRLLAIEQGRLRAEGLEVRLGGRLDSGADALDVQVDADITDLAAFGAHAGDLTASDLKLSLTARGPLMAPDLHLDATAAQLAAPGLNASGLRAKAEFQPDESLSSDALSASFTAEGQVEALSLDDFADLESVAGQRFDWQADGQFALPGAHLALRDLTIRGDGARLSAGGDLFLDDGRAEGKVELALDDLSRLAGLTGVALEGRGLVSGLVSFADSGEKLAAALSGKARQFAVDVPLLEDLFTGDIHLAADLRLGPGGLELNELTATSTRAGLSADVAFDAGFERITANYDLKVTDAAALSRALPLDLGGRAGVQGRATGAIKNPDLEGRLHLDRLTLEGMHLTGLSADYQVENPSLSPAGDITLSAQTPAGPASGKTAFALEHGRLRLDALSLESGGAVVEGDALVPLDGDPTEGELSFRVPHITPWLVLAELEGRGRAEGTLRLTDNEGRQAVDADARLDDAALIADGQPSLRIREATVQSRSPDFANDLSGRLTIAASGVSAGELHLTDLTLEADGDLESAEVRLQTTGEWQMPFEANATAEIGRDDDVWTARLTELAGLVAGQSLRLGQPAHLTYGPDAIEIRDFAAHAGSSSLRADGRIDEREVMLRLSAKDLPGALLGPLRPAGLDGVLGADIEVEGPRASPVGHLAFSARELRVAGLEDVPPLAAALDGDWRDNRLVLSGKLSGASQSDAALTADLPLVLDAASLAPSVPGSAPLAATLEWRGPIAPLWDLVPQADHELKGTGDIALEVTGTLANPQIDGQLSLTGGSYENLEAGTQLQDLTLVLDLAGTEATLAQLTAGDGESGQLQAGGSFAIDSASDYPFSVTTTLTDLLLVRRDEITGSAGGELALEGTSQEARLAGRLETGTIEIRLLDRLPPEVADLDVVEVHGGSAEPEEQTAAVSGSGGFALGLDLLIDMPRRVFVRGRGLDSEWSGRLEVGGTASQPEIAGNISLVRGQASILGEAFELDRGTISFRQGKEIDPLIDVVAVKDTGDLKAMVRISGSATQPNFELTSEPELPQDEIVAQVLFGKSATQLSGFQAAQVGVAAAQLSGSSDPASNVVERLRRGFGIDVLRFESVGAAGEESPGATAGKYVTDEVYLGVSQGAEAESGSVGVEVELTPNISVESDVTQTGESNVGVKFKYDY